MDLKVMLDHRDILVREGTKVTREREASRVTWDLQVHKEKEETRDKKVNQVTRE